MKKAIENKLNLWTRPSHYMGATWKGYYVFLGRNRDSETLENVNFDVAYETLQAIGPRKRRTVQIIREGHFLCGWVEWIAIHHSDKKAIAAANEMLERLDNYPVLDEERFSAAELQEHESYHESWFEGCSHCEYAKEDFASMIKSAYLIALNESLRKAARIYNRYGEYLKYLPSPVSVWNEGVKR